MLTRARSILHLIACLAGLYTVGCLLGMGLLIAGFKFGLLANIDILFYRGIVIIALAAALTLALLCWLIAEINSGGLGFRDAFAATVLSLALNVSFLIVVPVTVDRSISIFLLGAMAEHPDQALTPDEASRMFKSVYVDADRQIERRLHEQTVSGNLEHVGNGYGITRRGLFVIETARVMAWLFDSHAGLVVPRVDKATASNP